MWVASVPEDVKRTRSAHGTISRTICAQRTSRSWLAPGCVPSGKRVLDGGKDLGPAVTEQQGAMAAGVIDVLVAVPVPLA